MLAVDGNGLTEIVALFLLADESKEVIESAVEAFKKYNSSWTQTKVIMSDKDFTERDAFAGCFPDAKLMSVPHTQNFPKRSNNRQNGNHICRKASVP